MGIKPFPHLSILFVLVSLTLTNAGIVTYWGQNSGEGSLTEACDSGLYENVIVAFLSKFGNNQKPELNLAGHCNPASNGCQKYSSSIQNCHKKKVKVLLSIGGGAGTYKLTSPEDAKKVGDYIWNNFLGGNSSSRPLGKEQLDGVDFDIEGENRGDPGNYAKLAKILSEHGKKVGKKVYLTAAPQCPFPDKALNGALSTGLFDHVYIQFYNNPQCQFNPANPSSFENSWKQWTSMIKAAKFFVGLPASDAKEAAGSGYVKPEDVTGKILPFVKKSGGKYGGVMLWNRFYDKKTGYSTKIKNSV